MWSFSYYAFKKQVQYLYSSMKKTTIKRKGFTLIELMVVVAIIAFLATLAIPTFSRFFAKAKRTEAYLNLSSLYAAEKAYHAEHGRYTDMLNGTDGLGWKPEGYKGGGKEERFYYTYGFSSGSEGTSFFTGNLETPASALTETFAGKDTFLIAAAADIDGDGKYDVITVDQDNKITVKQDDLAD
jgi:prepilin-type N-terminal cleavage/methylation domain-containing protein